MKRTLVNFSLDAVVLLLMTTVISTGLIMGFLLPPGSGRLDVEAHGDGQTGRPISVLWGLGRHDWGDVHFWLSMALITGALIHLALHWRWIVAMITRPTPGLTDSQRRRRVVGGVMGLALVAVIIAAPWLAPIRTVARSELEAGMATRVTSSAVASIRGATTLREVEDLTGMPVPALLEALGLPASTSPEERLGRLRRIHGFAMNEVREAVDRWQELEAP